MTDQRYYGLNAAIYGAASIASPDLISSALALAIALFWVFSMFRLGGK